MLKSPLNFTFYSALSCIDFYCCIALFTICNCYPPTPFIFSCKCIYNDDLYTKIAFPSRG